MDKRAAESAGDASRLIRHPESLGNEETLFWRERLCALARAGKRYYKETRRRNNNSLSRRFTYR